MTPRVGLCLVLLVTSCATAQTATEPGVVSYGEPRVVATIDIPGLIELSGLAASHLRDDLFWAHNDSGNEPVLYAVGIDGRNLGTFGVRGASYLDWEDMASFELDGQPYLVIADFGDNEAMRPFVSLHFLPEPEIDEQDIRRRDVRIEWSLHYRYEDGPRDCESIAVDAAGKRVLLLSKRTTPPVFYELPLVVPEGEVPFLTAERSVELEGLPRPTAMDLSRGGERVVVQTAKHTYVYARGEGDDWATVFSATPQRIEIPRMPSVEAVAFGPDGRSIFLSREKRPTPLLRIDPVGE